MQKQFEPVIGLEIHIEFCTSSKMFCSCPANHFGKSPNSQTCPVCLGLPGALPVPNKKAVEWTQVLGAALGCSLAEQSHFDRKHYFYPDLPKGYQISQYDSPLARNGGYEGYGGHAGIRRVHLEEDTGKLFHTLVDGKRVSLVDFNRSGVPLVEVVTEPDLSSASEARQFAQDLQQLVRYLEISDADMEKGSMRLEANISLRRKTQNAIRKTDLPDYRVEIKNINSFKFLELAISYEIKRQEEILGNGSTLTQETRGFDEKMGTTKLQRRKEEAQDYRYFPEPDIPEFSFSEDYLNKIKAGLPELPKDKRKRFEIEYGLPPQYVAILTQTRELADYFEEAARVGKKQGVDAKEVANILVNKRPDIEKILPAKLIEILRRTKKRPVLLIEELKQAVEDVINENPKAAGDYKKGKEASIQFLVGQVMRKIKGKANPNKIAELVRNRLKDN